MPVAIIDQRIQEELHRPFQNGPDTLPQERRIAAEGIVLPEIQTEPGAAHLPVGEARPA